MRLILSIVGNAVALFATTVVPGITFTGTWLQLLVAGAIFGLLVAFALMFPSRVVYVFMLFPMRAKYFVILLGALELVLSLDRGGGVSHFAHLGGLVTGYLFLRHRRTVGAFRAALARRRNRRHTAATAQREQKLVDLQGEVDRILDKISTHGIDNLTPSEKRILEKASILFKRAPSDEADQS